MERLFQDFRFAARLLWKDRGFTATALLTLALCVGANAAIFAVVNSVLLRPLPVPEPERLALIYNSYPRAGVVRASNGVPDYYDRLRETDVFEEQALYNTRGVTIGIDGDPQRVTAMLARPSLLRMLHATPVRGRIFREEEGEPGQDRKVVLTHGLWQQLHGGSDAALGRELRINGVQYEIVGVLPAGFHFSSPEIRLWMPLSFSPEEKSDESRHNNNWSMIGRLKPGATVAQAQQQLDALNARNMERFPHFREILTNAGFRTAAASYQEDIVAGVRTTLYLLWGGVLFVLLIGTVNITNLVLIRSSARMKELATRHALGAGLARLTRQLLTETVLLALAGAAIGLALGYAGLAALTTLGIDRIPRGSEVRMDLTAVIFTVALAMTVGVLIALLPVVAIRRMNLSQAFREESRSGTSGRGARALRRLLVASQVAFAFMLLVGAGLLLASFERVLAIEPGFVAGNVMTARVSPPRSRYPDDADLRTFSARLLERVRALPGVSGAALSSSAPLGDDYSDSVILAEGYQMAPGESLISPYRVEVTPGYFEALGMSLRAGRTFSDGDTETAPGVVIVDDKLARKFWGNTNPVGRRMYRPDSAQDLTRPGPKVRWLTVIGVVGEVRMAGLVTTDDRVGAYYFPAAQEPFRTMTLIVKTASADPLALAPAIRRELNAMDPELPLYAVRTMEERIDESLVDRRTPMLLAVVFAGVALFLAGIGLYGVLAYQVTQRRREIGIRMALGSDARRIFTMVVREGVWLMAAGLLVGLGGAFAIRRTMESQLYGVGAMDPAVVSAVAAVLAAVALGACLVPARRAARTDPTIALNDQ
jgi:putative ABC transport system permease protein